MNVVVCFLGLLIVLTVRTGARPLGSDNDVQILRYENEVQAEGYNFAYETSDGTKRDETGSLNGNGALVVKGSYSYVGDDGVTYTVNYIADENGYRAEGNHLPKSVPELSEEEIVGVEEPTIGLSPSAVLSLVGG